LENILTSITYPSGRTVTFTLDQIGRIAQVSTTLNGNPKTLATGVSYLPYGGITGLTYGNGLSLSQGYDNQYRISSIVVGSLINLTYGYDANGNITSIGDAVNPPGGEPLGNPGTYTYQQGANRLLHIEGTPATDFGYDANGNTISENNRTYTYNLSDRLIRVEENGTTLGEYVYNGVGQRIKKVTQAETRIFHYDLSGHLIAETTTSGQTLVEYFYLGENPLAMIRPEEAVYYYHNDHLGMPQILTNESQNIVWKALYTPFGITEVLIETVENPFRFPGQYYDSETGLHYNWNRYYDPKTGRYLTPDPVGLEGGINLFPYVQNNPINYMDIWGLKRCSPLRCIPRGFWSDVNVRFSDPNWTLANYILMGPTLPVPGFPSPITYVIQCRWIRKAKVEQERRIVCTEYCEDECGRGYRNFYWDFIETREVEKYIEKYTGGTVDIFHALPYILGKEACFIYFKP